MRRRGLAAAATAAAIGTVAIVRPFGSQGCAIVGDCIAVGLAGAAPECAANGRVGASARAIERQRLGGRYRWAVISAGSNNPLDPDLAAQLRRIRAGLQADRVAWARPTHPRAGRIVDQVAAERGDIVVRFNPARDGVHPRSYGALLRDIRARLP